MYSKLDNDSMQKNCANPEESSDEETLAVKKRKSIGAVEQSSLSSNNETRSFHIELEVGRLNETSTLYSNNSMEMTTPMFYQNLNPELQTQNTYSAPKRKKSARKRKNSVPKVEKRKLYPCDCGIVFTTEEYLKQHACEINKSISDYSCNRCDRSFNTEQELKMHMHFHPEEIEILSCQLCYRRFQLKYELAQHMIEHEEHMYLCAKCPAKFDEISDFHDHYKVHYLEPKACPDCGLQLNTVKDLFRHVNSFHKDLGTTLCMHCGLFLFTTKERDQHINTHHDNLSGCDACLQKYHCKCTLPEHFDGSCVSPNNSLPVDDLVLPEDTKKSSEDENISDTVEEPGEQLFVECLYDVPMRKEDLSLSTKCAIISKMHNGKSVADICKFYQLTPEIVDELWEDRDNIVIPRKVGIKSCRYMNNVLDAKILEWLNNQRVLGVQVTGKMLINVAEEYAKECGFVVFNGNVKWLDRFKTRHKISLRPNWARKGKVVRAPNDAKWKEQFFNEIWAEACKDFAFEDIYTADEIGVYYNPSKGRILKHTGRKYIHGSSKDRFSILLCTNMTGKDRERILVCGTDDPLCNSHRNPNTLPVTYIRHSKAHFTTEMFEEFVKTWNMQLQRDNKKVLLLLDRASIHSKLGLSHLKLVFVPWKASIGLMPIKHGIYTKFREEFRKLILQEKSINALRGIDRNFTCLEGLEMIHKAWHRVPSSTIVESFKFVGYKVPENPIIDFTFSRANKIEDENLCRILREYDFDDYLIDLGNFDMYLSVEDENLTAQGTNGSVFGGNHRVIDQNSSKDEGEILPLAANKTESVEREKFVLKARALEDLEIIRKHIESNKSSHETFKAFMDIEKFLLRNPPINNA